MNMECHHRNSRCRGSGIVLGIGVILLGVVLLLEQMPGISGSPLLEFLKHLWPLILVAMGLARIREKNRPAHGWVLVTVGLILLANTLGHEHFAALAWPCLLLAAGIFIILRTLNRQAGPRPESAAAEDFLKGTAILSGFKHKIHSQGFRGGELTAIFGGLDLDLREVVMAGDSARIDVFLMFGGGEIRVPSDWEVTIEGTAIAGGVSDKGSPDLPGLGGRPRLLLTGLILFGGLEIRR
jgi:predicted membrane protein